MLLELFPVPVSASVRIIRTLMESKKSGQRWGFKWDSITNICGSGYSANNQPPSTEVVKIGTLEMIASIEKITDKISRL